MIGSLKIWILACVLLFGTLSPNVRATIPGIAGAASIIPGLGQTIDGRPGEGLAWFAASFGPLLTNDRVAQQVGFDIWMYNMYDAWRDAGGKPSTNHNVFVNYIGNYNPLNIVDPIGAPIVGVGAIAGNGGDPDPDDFGSAMIFYSFVGLGEEGLFRGFLFPGFSSYLGKWFGAVVSSGLFALVHDNDGMSDFYVRFFAGMLFCWQADRNKYDLRKNIFAHTWYDMFVGGPLSVSPYWRFSGKKREFVPGVRLSWDF
ncbi:MAG: CPBP family intramembrane metalloprotease [Bacteriovoracaceae bacterium]|nr:CPBP family intramembrane metalloprotease [Bacteriovoracaceae bacterium]